MNSGLAKGLKGGLTRECSLVNAMSSFQNVTNQSVINIMVSLKCAPDLELAIHLEVMSLSPSQNL